MLRIIADGRTGANRNVATSHAPSHRIIADGRTGANRNALLIICRGVTIIADGRTGANRNRMASTHSRSAIIADGRTGANRNDVIRRVAQEQIIAYGRTVANHNFPTIGPEVRLPGGFLDRPRRALPALPASDCKTLPLPGALRRFPETPPWDADWQASCPAERFSSTKRGDVMPMTPRQATAIYCSSVGTLSFQPGRPRAG